MYVLTLCCSRSFLPLLLLNLGTHSVLVLLRGGAGERKHIGEQQILKVEAIYNQLQDKNAYDCDKL